MSEAKIILSQPHTLPHTIIGICAFVFMFNKYAPKFENDDRFEYNPLIWFCIWSGFSLLPAIQMILMNISNCLLFAWKDLNLITGFGNFLMWFWGFKIICSNDGTILEQEYKNLYNVAIFYQIFTMFMVCFDCIRFEKKLTNKKQTV